MNVHVDHAGVTEQRTFMDSALGPFDPPERWATIVLDAGAQMDDCSPNYSWALVAPGGNTCKGGTQTYVVGTHGPGTVSVTNQDYVLHFALGSNSGELPAGDVTVRAGAFIASTHNYSWGNDVGSVQATVTGISVD